MFKNRRERYVAPRGRSVSGCYRVVFVSHISHARLFRTNNAVPEYPCLAGGKLESPAMHEKQKQTVQGDVFPGVDRDLSGGPCLPSVLNSHDDVPNTQVQFPTRVSS